jgi:branched-chain amino acid transport system permease protein
VIWSVFGGIVSIYGPVFGVYFLYPLLEGLHVVAEIRFLIFAAIIIAVLVFMPEGIAVWIRDKIERECPRCKLANTAWRKECRACGASLY